MKFITFEGSDFSGKSTQVKLLKQFFKNQQIPVFVTREPGGSNFAEKIRVLLLSNKEMSNPLIEYLLIAAARKDHVDNVIKKKLQQGYYVISDRFYDSSLCYQGYYKNLDFKILEEIKHLTINQFQPDLTFLIDISIDEIKRRAQIKRKKHNAYDKKDMRFYQTIKNGYLKIAKDSPKRMIVIDGNKKINDMQNKITQIIQERIL